MPDLIWVVPAVSFGLVAVMFVPDHPQFAARTRRQTVTLDRAYAQELELHAAMEQLPGAQILQVVVEERECPWGSGSAPNTLRPVIRSIAHADRGMRLADVDAVAALRTRVDRTYLVTTDQARELGDALGDGFRRRCNAARPPEPAPC